MNTTYRFFYNALFPCFSPTGRAFWVNTLSFQRSVEETWLVDGLTVNQSAIRNNFSVGYTNPASSATQVADGLTRA